MGEIRFVGTGETRGYPYPVCKKEFSCVPDKDIRVFVLTSILCVETDKLFFPLKSGKNSRSLEYLETLKLVLEGQGSTFRK